MEYWESQNNSDNKGDTWNSINDALQAIYSLSRVTKGSDTGFNNSLISSKNNQSENSGTATSVGGLSESVSNNSGAVDFEEASSIGAGRGRLLQELEKQFSRQHIDQNIHTDLKLVVGPGFSNELIEKYFGSASSSSNDAATQETGIFSDYENDNESNIDFIVGESDIMKKVTEAEKPIVPAKKNVKPMRCRNAVILNLTKKKPSNEPAAESETKQVPVLKGPDVFLPTKSYKKAVSSGRQVDAPLFTAEDFPAL